MLLKKITLSGFKSFADRVTLNFDRGVTGVIGPNGCGKSNVIDAVRWVMGEQNAKNLRGEVATDIIFAGSDRRKPLAMAEVSLTFDNSEGDAFCPPEYRHEPQIEITRRLYGDGEREYQINRKNCRLKDVVAFFATTGLGGRSYSMIQQGQVERILSAKPEDIREIIEEAAGTLIFKTRKGESLKKLDSTQQNLLRIEDILAEIRRQQESLGEQVEKAKQWQDLTTKLRSDELSVLAHNYHFYHGKLAETEDQLNKETNKEVEFLAALSHYEARHTELQQILDEADPELQGLQEKITAVREDIARAENTMQNADRRIIEGDKRLGDIGREIEEDGENLKMLESQVQLATDELAAAGREASTIASQIEGFEDQVAAVDESAQVFQNRLEEFDDELRNLERLMTSNLARRDGVKKDLARVRREKDEQAERLAGLEADAEETKVRVREAEAKLAEQKSGLDIEIQKKHQLEAAIAGRYTEIRENSARRDELKELYFNAKAKSQSLREIEVQAGGVIESWRTLREEAGAGDLVKGLLADHVSFNKTAAELSQRVRTAFERWAERLVIESMGDLNELVRLAQKHQLSTLPIVVLGSTEKFDDKQAEAWAKTVDAEPLSKFIKVSKSVKGLDSLLNRLYHLPVLQLSENLLAGLPAGVIVFTAQGVSFTNEHEFLVEGGGSKGLLSQRAELDELERSHKTLETDLARSQALLDSLEVKQNEDRQIIAEIDKQLQQENKDVLGLMSELQAAQQLAEHKAELINQSRSRVDELTRDEQAAVEEVDGLDTTRASLEDERKTLAGERDDLKEEASSITERREEVYRQHQARKVELAKYQERADALRNSFTQTKAQLDRLQGKLSRRYDEQAGLQQDIAAAKIELEKLRGEIERLVLVREELDAQVNEKRNHNSGIHEELRVIENRLKECRENQNKVQKILSDKNMALERIRIAAQGCVEQARERYQLELETYDFERDEDFDHDKRTRAVQNLRAKIEAMGPVNMMAIKEFEALKERHQFIETQRDEVMASIGLLEGAIKEMEETAKDRFLGIYQVVDREFRSLFPILFPGGEACLELSNPADPLASGVEILARLPGKKQQRMAAFSGGEKAFTAIALVFALLKTKPTPFCFLDEVDAPLDEANVGRFNKLIATLSEQFQFILITHNRRTMEVLDTLYGVTMQEPGVSSIVGVDMTKDLPPHLQKSFARPVEGATAQ